MNPSVYTTKKERPDRLSYYLWMGVLRTSNTGFYRFFRIKRELEIS